SERSRCRFGSAFRSNVDPLRQMKMVQLALGSRFRGNERSRARLLDLEKSGEAESVFNCLVRAGEATIHDQARLTSIGLMLRSIAALAAVAGAACVNLAATRLEARGRPILRDARNDGLKLLHDWFLRAPQDEGGARHITREPIASTPPFPRRSA